MSMVLTDNLGSTFTFPANFRISGYSWKKKTRSVAIAFKDGGDETGDKKLDTRIIEIEGILADNATYLATQATMNSWLYKNDLQLSVTAGKHINVKTITGVSFTFPDGGYNRISRVKFSCICPDPFFYADALTTQIEIIAASPTVFTVTNASLFDVLPIIEIVNSANNFSFTLENATDVGSYFAYIDAAFIVGNILIVDNKLGTVKKEGMNSIQYFSGSFSRLLAGVNSFVYTGAVCTLTFKYYALEI